jgi:non-ribosomal peptide synthetase component F
MSSTFMPWVQYLPEVGDPIQKRRESLTAKLNLAYLLERRAAQLVAEARAGERELTASIAENWSPREIEDAERRAGIDRQSLALATIRDDSLRVALQAGDSHLPASEAIRVFGAAEVLRIETVWNANDVERLATLDRVIAWWTFAGKPVYDRMESHASSPGERSVIASHA